MNETVRAGLDTCDAVAEVIADVKPKLRGWLHLGTAPLTLAAGIVLIALSPTTTTRIGSALFTGTALILFTVSAIYHTGTWSPRTWAFLRRFDHANIFLLIAGSYTPFSLLLLDGTTRWVLLATVWAGAILGVLFRVFWTDAPRWLYVPIYIALGWAAVFFLPAFLDGATRLGVGIGDRDVHDDRGRRRALHVRRRRLRLQAPQPVAALVRLPRGVPHLHDPGVRRRTTSASRWRRTPCADAGSGHVAGPSAQSGHRCRRMTVAVIAAEWSHGTSASRPPVAGVCCPS